MIDIPSRPELKKGLSGPEWQQVEFLCKDFQQQLQSGGHPLIETSLSQLPAKLHAVALMELLATEIDHRTKNSQSLQIDEYRRRFPDHIPIVNAAFASLATLNTPAPERVAPDSGRLAARLSHSPHPQLQPGMMLGNCRIESLIGRGGMGEVYLAWNETLGCYRAIKLVLASRGTDPVLLQRFRREVQLLARLQHPNVTAATDAGEIDSLVYLVMEYLAGTELSALLKRSGPLPIRDVIRVATHVASGLEYIHRQQLVHRDIKPSNLMLTDDGTVKILDLGLARLAAWSQGSELDLTSPAGILGTLEYVSPEQARNPTIVDGRSDLYSLGCTLYELLTGRPPFADHFGIVAKLKAHAELNPPPVRSIRPDVPPSLAAIVDRLMQKDPQHRFADASALLDALRAIHTRPSVPLEETISLDQSTRHLPLRRRHYYLAALIAFMSIVILIAGYYAWRGERKSEVQHAHDSRANRNSNATERPNRQNSNAELAPNRINELTLFTSRGGRPSIETVQLLKEGATCDPLGPRDLFKLRGSMQDPGLWFIVWFDTAGVISVVANSERSTNVIDYPGNNDFQSISPDDPAGSHILAIVVTDSSANLASTQERLVTIFTNNQAAAASMTENWMKATAAADNRPLFLPPESAKQLQSWLPRDFKVIGAVVLDTQR